MEKVLSPQFDKLKTLLTELFQLDKPDLDFGIYRLLRVRGAEVLRFLETRLPLEVQEALQQFQASERHSLEAELGRITKQAIELGADPDTLPRVQELKERLQKTEDLAETEAEIYEVLFAFFRRYYSDGDFLTRRVYKAGVYALPYEGEEVKLYWANYDQYYIKTSEYLRDYAFQLEPKNSAHTFRVHFRLVDAAEGEHGNITELEKRVFVFRDPITLDEQNGSNELILRFEYRPVRLDDWPDNLRADARKPPGQRDLLDMAEARILGSVTDDPELKVWGEKLARSYSTERNGPAVTVLRSHLNRYVARSTFDYFIHKDLGSFLRRELAFFIKNEVMHLDDIADQSAVSVDQYLGKVKVLRQVALKIIDFLAQVEDFEKALWLKKKFITNTRWCVTLGAIAEIKDGVARDALLDQVAANGSQHSEWLDLHTIGSLTEDGDIVRGGQPLTRAFLLSRPTLMVDTAHFPETFVAALLHSLGDLDELTDGVLIHGENFQALNLMQERYRASIDCIYLDPPFNAKTTEIAYKNSYKHSSWLTLMENRLREALPLGTPRMVLVVAIDEVEQERLGLLLSNIFTNWTKTCITVVSNPTGQQGGNFSSTHEYAYFIYPEQGQSIGLEDREDEDREGKPDVRPLRNVSGGEAHLREASATCFYPIYVKDGQIVGFGAVSPDDFHPGSMNIVRPDGVIEVYPIDPSERESKWVLARDTVESKLHELSVVTINKTGLSDIMRTKTRFNYKTVWTDSRYSANSWGSRILNDILGKNNFKFPKSIFTVRDCIDAALGNRDTGNVLDYFAGSGTTAQAVVMLNREDGGRRRFVLVDVESYFDTALLPRLKKITFTPEWRESRPRALPTAEEARNSPRLVKVQTLESYEDALNNLKLNRSGEQQMLLDSLSTSTRFKEQYLLRYVVNIEARGGASLLNIASFTDPDNYVVSAKAPGCNETRLVRVDLVETFNWLLGLRVKKVGLHQTFSADFTRDQDGRLHVARELKADAGPYWLRYVFGIAASGRAVLVIWRNRPGGDSPEGIQRDNAVLAHWFFNDPDIASLDSYDFVYVNGDTPIETMKPSGASWTTKLTEQEFYRLMFATVCS